MISFDADEFDQIMREQPRHKVKHNFIPTNEEKITLKKVGKILRYHRGNMLTDTTISIIISEISNE